MMIKEIGVNRPKFGVTINGKEFSLVFVPNYARYRYIEFYDRVKKIFEAAKIKDEQKRQEMIDLLSDDSESDMLYEMIQVILEANGYEFNRDWWERNTDTENQLEFVRICIECADGDKKKALSLLGV